MTTRHALAPAILAPLTVALLVAAAGCGDDATPGETGAAPDAEPDATPDTAPESVDLTSAPESACPTEGDEFEVAKLYIEHNATDADTGVHAKLGGQAWNLLCVSYPDGTPMIVADPVNSFDTLGISDLLWESREPENSEVSIDTLEEWFPEGQYLIGAISYEGTPMVREAWLSHDIPDEPEIAAPALVEEPEETTDALVPVADLLVEWEPVTATLSGDPLTVTGYEVIVTDEGYEDEHGNSTPVYDVHVPADRTSLTVPAGFFEPVTVYELEVLVLEESGNQTISVGFFATE